MEIIVILIALVIIGYVIYQTLPSTKFTKANAILEAGNTKDSSKIFESIFSKHPEASSKLAECKLRDGIVLLTTNESEAIGLFNQVIEIKKDLPVVADKSLYELVEAKAWFEICKIGSKNVAKENTTESKVAKIKELLNSIDTATKNGLQNEFSKLYLEQTTELSNLFFSIGIQREKAKNLSEALKYYRSAKEFAIQSQHSKVITNSTVRVGICKLKNGEQVEKSIFDEVNKSSADYKRDFYLRYTKWLLLDNNYAEAEAIITTNLNLASSVIDTLKEIIRANKIRKAIAQVNEINEALERLYENSFSVEEIKEFYERLDGYIDCLKPTVPAISDKVGKLKPSLFNRLLFHYVSEKQFANAIILIQKFPMFWESPELLKNLGICCYGFLTNNIISEKNYRTIISSWLTSVYSDRVILKSLEDTNWDDEFTFSLKDAIGSNYELHDNLPDNVNYDDIDEGNISIGEAQSELLLHFEAALHQKISDSNLTGVVQNFYATEKEAINKIVSVISKDILFASPYFAKTYGLNEVIINALDEDYVDYENESSLEAGIPYLKDYTDTYVREYATARELVNKAVSAIKNENLSELKSVNSDQKKSLVEKYETINSTVEDLLYNTFASKIEVNDENENLIPLMEEGISFASATDKLKYQYSNYVSLYCVAKVNKKEMSNFTALSLMKKAYLFSKENPRICNNIVTLISFNLMDVVNDRTKQIPEIYRILDEIASKKSNVFKNSSVELAKERKEILLELMQAGVDTSLIGGDLPAIRILANSGKSLTQEGEKMKKVLSYMKMLSD